MMILGRLPLQADELAAWSAGAVMTLIVGAIIWLVLSRTVRLPRLMELGMTLVALGMVAAVEPVLTDYAGDHLAIALRWCLIGSGIGLIMLSWTLVYRGRRAAGCPMQRVEDSSPIALDERPHHHAAAGAQRTRAAAGTLRRLRSRYRAWRDARRRGRGIDPTVPPADWSER